MFMSYQQKLYYCVVGFFAGNILLGLIGFGFYSLTVNQTPVKQITFDVALRRI
jgi:hypothetical protein